MSNDLNQLYRDTLLDYAAQSRMIKRLSNPSWTDEQFNPSCGDRVILDARIDGAELRLGGAVSGCSICQASFALMLQYLDILGAAVIADVHRMVTAGEISEAIAGTDLESLQGVSQFPARVGCALLPWNALQSGLKRVA